MNQKKLGVGLHLGTNFQEIEDYGKINRNEIRHYHKSGRLMCCTFKTMCLDRQASHPNPPLEHVLKRDKDDQITMIRLRQEDEPQPNSNEFWKEPLAAGLICNDLWGWQESKCGPITTQYKNIGMVDLLFHATNGQKDQDHNTFDVFNKWHDAFLRMSAWNCNIPILTVDSCTPWEWDGEDESIIDKFPTSSESGFMHIDGWRTSVPRKGRQYFYYDYNPQIREFKQEECSDDTK